MNPPIPGQPLFTGKEENFQRNEDQWIDHCRSMTCGQLYSPAVFQKASGWASDAMIKAKQRMKTWK